ncbi:MAG: serine/threonine-protein kinase [Gemmatimonadales bacterium]
MPDSHPGDWRRIEELFHAALDQEPASRELWLREVTGDDESIVSEVLALLAADAPSADAGVVSRLVSDALGAATETATPPWIGRMVGPYRLEAEVGHGGMGTVYLATRSDDAYRARVAIKFVRGGIAGPELLRRLKAERQILADLAHPGIARLLDGGTADDGTPYLIMEYIEGEPVDRYCAARRLELGARVELLLRISRAVQHAHQALVVHRDLKPSNILVKPDGTPKLVDFGIAKVLDAAGGEETLTGLSVMTPAYASPEQVRGQRVTVATDIYSLGVVAYQLLAGRLPLPVEPGTPLVELARRVEQVEPPRPSAVAEGPAAAWAGALAGDLDAILLKALAKEPERRYASVEQFAADLARWRDREPVQARPAGAGYRFRKFVARNRLPVVAVALVVGSLATGLGVALWQRGQAEHARAETVSTLARANATRDFLLGLFQASNPVTNGGKDLTASDLLAKGMAQVDSLSDQPALQAELLHQLGRIEAARGDYRQSVGLLRRAIATHERTGSPDSALYDIYSALGNSMHDLGWPDSAAAAWQRAVDIGARYRKADDPDLAGVMGNLGIAYSRMGLLAKAESTYQRQIAIERLAFDSTDPTRAYALNNLGLLYANSGRFAEAEPVLRENLGVMHGAWGDTIATVAFGYDNLGVMLREAGRYDEAEPILRRGLAIREKLLGPKHRFTGESYSGLGKLLAQRGRGNDYIEADSMLHRALTILQGTLDPDHPAVSYVTQALGNLAYNQGRLKDAEGWFRRTLAQRQRSRARDNPAVMVQTLTALGHTLRDEGSPEAAMVFRRADSLARARLDRADPFGRRAEIGLALVLADSGARGRADSLYTEGMAALAARIGPDHPYVLRNCRRGAAAGLADAAACADTVRASAS